MFISYAILINLDNIESGWKSANAVIEPFRSAHEHDYVGDAEDNFEKLRQRLLIETTQMVRAVSVANRANG